MIFLSSIATLNVLAIWTSKAVLGWLSSG